jgi:PTH1 family peptidyl-tRNA hydrolase
MEPARVELLHLIVGLGNPGLEYARTRHNAGFMLAERVAARWGAEWRLESKFEARLALARRGGRRALLCQPQTFMNASGAAVAAVRDYYRVALGRVLVAVDDADLPLGELRLRAQGSSGGHHGLESVEQHLGSRAYARLRLGIGRRAEDGREITSYVLSRFTAEEAVLFEQVLDRAADQAACWLDEGVEAAMNRYNGVLAAPPMKDN